ncbi:MAG TPA: sulfurtransferase [Albitalea sp.]|nr:sulfurtransferase [Albitalea sp.]
MKRLAPAFAIAVNLMLATAVLLAHAQGRAAQESAIVDTTYVVEAIKRNAVVWDTRSEALYKQGHLPGAVNIGDIGQVLRDENREDYIALQEIEKLLGAAGIDPSREIVVYGFKGNPYVYFGLVTLQYFNAANAKIFHGGIDDWKAAGQPLAMEASKLAPVALKLTPKPELLIDTAEVLRKIHDPKVQIVDARTPQEFRGEDIRALRGGHIPGAIPIHYMENWIDPDAATKLEKQLVSNRDGMSLKPRADLQALYSRLDPDKETIVYCQSGVRASETATVLRDLGFKRVRVYDSSWIGYGNTLAAPVEDLTFFNIATLQGKLGAMSRRVEALEKELAATKAAK